MKNPHFVPAAALAFLMVVSCDRKSSGAAKQLEELQRKASEAVDRQKELEQQLADEKLATERDAIERDRMQIENDRAELERRQGDDDAAKSEEIRKREEALASREGRLEQVQSDLEEKKADLTNRGAQLNDRERDLAGREALPFQQTNEEQVPVGDYGMFYDQLSSYGSWFQTLDYGYVWQPVVVSDSNWRPYCRGRWVCSDRGWTWVSDEPFGWATYHYGRWTLIRGRGWVWVPGSEWAPCWVSWRQSGKHIGWAPLPPETLAYRNNRWDSSVDVQFGIGALWYNFVEFRYFGGSLYSHCLPVSQNVTYFQESTNITYIHIENRQVICGGPRYRDVCDRIGQPIPFCRLEIDRHPRPSPNVIGMRPQIKGDRLLISAPNVDASWNDGLKPRRVKGNMDAMVVERNEPLRPEITDRFRKSREENVRIADRSIQEMGGNEQFPQRRVEQLDQNRKQVENDIRIPGKPRDVVKTDDRKQRQESRPDVIAQGGRPVVERPIVNQKPDAETNPPQVERARQPVQTDPNRPETNQPRVMPREGVMPAPQINPQRPIAGQKPEQVQNPTREQKPQVEKHVAPPRPDPQIQERQRQVENSRAGQQAADQLRENAKQRQQEQSQQVQEQMRQQQEQSRQKQEQARLQEDRQRQAEQARAAQQQALEQQREQARQRQQQEQVRQQQLEQARQAQEDARQQQQEQMRQRQQEQAQQEQREMQRQQERARQQEDSQRQQQENQRQQQEQSRQQRQQEDSRQKQEKDLKDQEDQRKKGR